MNRGHLGDSLDFWKGRMIHCLGDALRRVRIVPMLSDAEPWNSAERVTYESLIGAGRPSVLNWDRFSHRTRAKYFEGMLRDADGDIFIDPDTGVAAPALDAKHVSPAECAHFLRRDNLVLVYQHARRASNWAAASLDRIRNGLLEGGGCAYASPQVAMLFLSKSPERIESVRSILDALLGPVSARWIIPAPRIEPHASNRPEPSGGRR